MFFPVVSCTCIVTSFEEKGFRSWMKQHGKMYIGDDYLFRLGVYLTADRFIKSHNKGDTLYQLGHNQFSAMTMAELESVSPQIQIPNQQKITELKKPRGFTLPDYLDWRENGIEWAPIHDQLGCGSCYAFSVTGAMTSQWKKTSGEEVDFSASNVIDCCTTTSGCSGGYPPSVATWIVNNQQGKLASLTQYPYEPLASQCYFDHSMGYGQLTGTNNYGSDCTKAMEVVTLHGPIGWCLSGNIFSFKNYQSGIYRDPACSKTVWHAMVIVGFGQEHHTPYFILRNSWGSHWGENGYMRILRENGFCGQSQAVHYIFNKK